MSIRDFQHAWNSLNHVRQLHYPTLAADGKPGPHTDTAVQLGRYYVGVGTEDWRRNSKDISDKLVWDLNHPFSRPSWESRLVNWRRRVLATKRCKARLERWKAGQHPKPHPSSGLVYFDGRLCAAWIAPWLLKARQHGWRGVLVSGFRDPAYSESLCYRMCGAPRCPGRCAGRASNHSGIYYPHGAADITDFWNGRAVLQRIGAPLVNHLPNDPVHVSATGY